MCQILVRVFPDSVQTWVRRQKLRRTMVVDLQSAGRSLPFELVAHIFITPSASSSLQSLNLSFYMEFSVDGAVHETGVLCAPLWTKDVILPLTHIARHRKVDISLFRSQSNHQTPIVTSLTIGEIVDELNSLSVEALTSVGSPTHTVVLQQEKHWTTSVELRINEHTIFNVVNTDQCFAEGQLNQVVMMENKISHRLKEEIIMLSLSLESNCNGLLKDITLLRTEGQNFIGDYDLINVLQDINQIQGTIKSSNTDLNKVISYLRHAETSQQQIFYLHYPYYMPLFAKWIPFTHFFGEQDLSSMSKDLIQRVVDNYHRTRNWFSKQPACSSSVMKYYHHEWHREARSMASYTYRVYLFTRSHDDMLIDADDISNTFGFFWSNIYDYYNMLRHLSVIKYNLNSGDRSVKLTGMMISMEGRSFEKCMLSIDFQEEFLEISMEDARDLTADDLHLFPLRIPFEHIEAVEVSHAHSLTMSHLLELKLLSVTSFQLANSPVYEHEACIDIDTADGQHYAANFSIRHETSGGGPPEPAIGEINDTVRVLLPYWIAHAPTLQECRVSPVPFSGSGKSNGPGSASCLPPSFVSISLSARPAPTIKSSNYSIGSVTKRASSSQPNSPMRSDREPIQNTPDSIRLGQAALPAIHNITTLITEQELQVVLDKPNFELRIDLVQVQWMEERIAAQGWSVYLLVFLADREGQVVALAEPLTVSEKSSSSNSMKSMLGFSKKKSSKDVKEGAPSTVTGGSGGSMNGKPMRSGYLRRTAVISAEDMYRLDGEATLVIDSLTYPALDAAHNVLVEIWGVDADSGVDTCLGEALVPICTAASVASVPVQRAGLESDDDTEEVTKEDEDVSQHVIRTPVSAPNTPDSGRHAALAAMNVASSKHLFTLGTINMRVSMVPSTDTATPSTSGTNRSALRGKGNLVKLAMNMRPLQPGDCAWPAQILSSSEKRLETEVFFLSIMQHGLLISYDTSSCLGGGSHTADRVSVLEECKERISNSSSGFLKLSVPYVQISSTDLHILSEHTLLLCLTLHRQMSNNPNSKAQLRSMEINFLLGPCLAEDMYASICNNISVQQVRQGLSTHLLSKDRDQEESFHMLAKSLESNIYQTMLLIEQKVEEQRMLLCEDMPETFTPPTMSFANTDKSPSMEDLNQMSTVSPVDIDSCCLQYILSSMISKNPGIKQLYLRLASFRIFLWYLLEQAPACYSAEKHYLEANWIDFDERSLSTVVSVDHNAMRLPSFANSPINTTNYSTEVDALLYRVGEHMRRLEQEVRHVIYRALHNNYMDVSGQLTKIIFTKYREIITMLLDTIDRADALDHDEIAETVGKQNNNPQKKRDLIKFIITHDEIFESYCNYILRSHNYKFNKRPLLSICINFEDLLNTFSNILDTNLLSWNTRTLKHFMDYTVNAKTGSSKDNKSPHEDAVLLPWEIVTIYDKKVDRELYISHIPETIQLQLNVEIGLKKIMPMNPMNPHGTSADVEAAVHSSNIMRSMESFQRIEAMNRKIMGSIILSYIALAAEYENILNKYAHNVHQYLAIHQVRGSDRSIYSNQPGTDARASILRFGNSATAKKDEKDSDEIIYFLFSIVNDCHRINSTHIPQTVEMFLSDYNTIYQHTSNRNQNVYNIYQKNYVNKRNAAYMERKSFSVRESFLGNRESFASHSGARKSINGKFNILSVNNTLQEASGDNSANLSFSLCIKVVNTVTYKTLNELSNQLFLFSELRYYFVNAFDDYIHTYKYHNVQGKAEKSASTTKDVVHSPMQVIKATLIEFLTFANRHLIIDHMYALVYICVFKIIIRYLLFLRDYHEYKNRFAGNGTPRGNTRASFSESGRSSMSSGPSKRISFSFRRSSSTPAPVEIATEDDFVIMEVWEQDLKHLKSMFAEIRHRVLGISSASPRSRGNSRDENESKAEEEPEELKVSNTAQRFMASCVSLLKKLSFSIMSALTNDWAGDASINRFLANNFGIQVSPFAF